MNFPKFCQELEALIEHTYISGVTQLEAESLAARFLHAQMVVSAELKKSDLDSRMKKTGFKSVKAAIYANLKSDTSVKHTVDSLDHAINLNEVVQVEAGLLDTAEVERDELIRYYNIFREAHIYYRGVGKGKYE